MGFDPYFVQGSGFRVLDSGFWVQSSRFKVRSGLGELFYQLYNVILYNVCIVSVLETIKRLNYLFWDIPVHFAHLVLRTPGRVKDSRFKINCILNIV